MALRPTKMWGQGFDPAAELPLGILDVKQSDLQTYIFRGVPMARSRPPKAMKTRRGFAAESAAWTASPGERATNQLVSLYSSLLTRRSIAVFLAALFLAAAAPPPDTFRFVILGDRTGETEDHIYEQIWAEATKTNPAFVVAVGDTIQGLNDTTAETEWRQAEEILALYHRFPLYLAPGNHDVWDEPSVQLFEKHAGHPLHYSVDYGPAHFTILDNSRSDQFSAGELSFLEQDLKTHASQPLKFIVSHRPSWILSAAARNTDFPLHQIARKYGVRYVIAGHLHELLHFNLEGIDYLSMPSSGGHLRGSAKYEDGWFFGYATADVHENTVDFAIHELDGRNTLINDWGPQGLVPSR
ncbi:MAG TPA: metallophosphoesterase [Bryobacteraceae bacterium]|nr:metallophosphoesterase [Bryobacteraceae bacterium]